MRKRARRIYCKMDPLEVKIAKTFYEMGERIDASEDLKSRINCRILEEEKKEERNMKHLSVKKVVIGVAAACLLVGTVCIAGSGKGYLMTGKGKTPSYTQFSELSKVEEKFGHKVDAVDQFKNGYKCVELETQETDYVNEAGQKEESRPTIYMRYERGTGDRIYYSIDEPFSNQEQDLMDGRLPEKTMKCGDVTVSFYRTTYKFVPVGYERTEEDLKNLQRDDYEMSEGSETVEIKENFSVIWTKDGLNYLLGGMDLSISPEEMLSMAAELIESGAEK